MADDNYEDGHDLTGIDFLETNVGQKGKGFRSQKNPPDPRKRKSSLLFVGAALLIIILIIAIAFIAGNGSSVKPISDIQTRIKPLEEKVAHFGGMEGNIASIQQQQETLQQAVSGLESSLKSLQERLGHLSREVASLKKRMGITPASTKSTALIRNKLLSETRPRYHVVLKGESLYKIAKKYGLSLQELYRLNNLTSKSVIHPGLRLMITPESKK